MMMWTNRKKEILEMGEWKSEYHHHSFTTAIVAAF